MAEDRPHVTVSFPYAGLLGIAFVVLKLTGYITWSWWWVTAPFWAPIVLLLAGLCVVVIVGFVALLLGHLASR